MDSWGLPVLVVFLCLLFLFFCLFLTTRKCKICNMDYIEPDEPESIVIGGQPIPATNMVSIEPLPSNEVPHIIINSPTCPICQGTSIGNVTTTSCNHEFHDECLERWLEDNTTCPNCREELELMP